VLNEAEFRQAKLVAHRHV